MLLVPTGISEPSPMEESFEGNPIVVISLRYEAGIGGGSDIEGEVVIELFQNVNLYICVFLLSLCDIYRSGH